MQMSTHQTMQTQATVCSGCSLKRSLLYTEPVKHVVFIFSLFPHRLKIPQPTEFWIIKNAAWYIP